MTKEVKETGPLELVIVTGLSGAGRTQAIRCFEDLGYFCIDNLPPVLLAQFIDLSSSEGSHISKVALVIDSRGGDFFADLSKALEEAKKKKVHYRILFLDASNDTLIRRFAETRRKHPLHEEIPVGINLERQMLLGIRAKADKVVDTSSLTPRQLWSVITDLFMDVKKYKEEMTVSFVSFGFKYGCPTDADIILDVRFLSSPFYIEPLQSLSGLDALVKEYVANAPATKNFLKKFGDLFEFLLPHFKKEGRGYITVALGSEEGRHRSVALTHEIVGNLQGKDYKIVEWHRDIERK